MATLSKALIKNFPKEYRYYANKSYVYNEIKQYSRNKLLYLDNTVDGIKTGYTKKAGYCLVSSANRGKRRLISVVMGAKNPELRTNVSKSLLEYGFRFYETHKIFNADDNIHNARLYNGEKSEISLGVKEDSYVSIPRRSIKKIKKKYVVDRNLTAPVEIGEKVGFVAIQLNNKTVTRIELFAMEAIGLGSIYQRTLDSILKN